MARSSDGPIGSPKFRPLYRLSCTGIRGAGHALPMADISLTTAATENGGRLRRRPPPLASGHGVPIHFTSISAFGRIGLGSVNLSVWSWMRCALHPRLLAKATSLSPRAKSGLIGIDRTFLGSAVPRQDYGRWGRAPTVRIGRIVTALPVALVRLRRRLSRCRISAGGYRNGDAREHERADDDFRGLRKHCCFPFC